jgi:hypothetical protein
MRDPQTLSKLFKIHIPHPPALDHYLDALERAPAYAGARDLATRYIAWEDRLLAAGSTPATARSLAISQTIDTLKNNPVHARFLTAEIGERTPRIDARAKRRGELFISIDMVRANFNTLRRFDDEGALGQDWPTLCQKLGVDPLLIDSKSFRQIVFGNLNPKLSQRLQHAVMSALLGSLVEAGVDVERDVAFLSHDEIVLACGPQTSETDKLSYFLGILDQQTFERPTRITLLRHESLDRDRVREVVYDRRPDGGIAVRFARLFGVPTHQFYVYLKRDILNEPVEAHDRYFWSDSRLAMWVDVEG